MMLTIQTDRTLIRAHAESTRYILARVNAPRASRRGERLPVNVGIVLDRSGSMADERKFTLAREAVEQSLRMLRPDDRFSLVVYDTEIDVLSPSAFATPDVKRRAMDSLRAVGPRGGTDLGAGWLRGCEQVSEWAATVSAAPARGPSDAPISRCLLLTDGLANHGITNRDELASHAAELRRLGVATSTFGVGADFDERLLRDMAHEGGGNFYFIEGASQIPEMLTGELGEALEITMRDAVLAVRFADGSAPAAEGRERGRIDVLNRFRTQRTADRGELRVQLGDLTSEQEIDTVLRVELPRGAEGNSAGVMVSLHAGGEPVAGESQAIEWRYASHLENDLQSRNRAVDRAVAAQYAARARAEATERNRDGDYQQARHVLEATARRIRTYAGDDPELNALVTGLGEDRSTYGVHMTAAALKMSVRDAEVMSKSRGYLGRARKRTT